MRSERFQRFENQRMRFVAVRRIDEYRGGLRIGRFWFVIKKRSPGGIQSLRVVGVEQRKCLNQIGIALENERQVAQSGPPPPWPCIPESLVHGLERFLFLPNRR